MRRRCAAGIVGVRWGSERNGGLGGGGGGQTVVGASQQLHPLSLSFSTIYNAGAQTLGGKKLQSRMTQVIHLQKVFAQRGFHAFKRSGWNSWSSLV